MKRTTHSTTDPSMSGVLAIAMVLLMKETRSTVLLTKMAKNLRKETGDQRYRARVEDEGASFRTMLKISLTRPICTRPLLSDNRRYCLTIT